MATIEVKYKGESVGALSFEQGETAARFEYFTEFVEKGIPLAPLTMPLESRRIYTFPGINWDTFTGPTELQREAFRLLGVRLR